MKMTKNEMPGELLEPVSKALPTPLNGFIIKTVKRKVNKKIFTLVMPHSPVET